MNVKWLPSVKARGLLEQHCQAWFCFLNLRMSFDANAAHDILLNWLSFVNLRMRCDTNSAHDVTLKWASILNLRMRCDAHAAYDVTVNYLTFFLNLRMRCDAHAAYDDPVNWISFKICACAVTHMKLMTSLLIDFLFNFAHALWHKCNTWCTTSKS
jgi:hypothetical protein